MGRVHVLCQMSLTVCGNTFLPNTGFFFTNNNNNNKNNKNKQKQILQFVVYKITVIFFRFQCVKVYKGSLPINYSGSLLTAMQLMCLPLHLADLTCCNGLSKQRWMSQYFCYPYAQLHIHFVQLTYNGVLLWDVLGCLFTCGPFY